MSYRIGVLSDTHGLLRQEIRERLQGCDRILHAGDIHTPAVAEELNRIAPAVLVRGNADGEWAADLPETQVIEDLGIRIFMIHNKKHITEDMSAYDLVIFGHSHKYEEKRAGGTVWLNPGSCGPRRFRLPATMAMLTVEDNGQFKIERIDVETAAPAASSEASEESVRKCLPAMMKEIDKGATVEQLARRFHLSPELAEQICRLYLTHPGVDAEGILRKMGR